MATGSISDFVNKAESVRGRAEVGSAEPKVGAFVPRRDHNPRELKSWAKRTGFVSNFSGETVGSSSGRNESSGGGFDLERGSRGGSGSSPKFEIDPVLGRTRPTGEAEIEPAGNGGVRSESEETMRVERRRRSEDERVLGRDEERSVGNEGNENRNNGNGVIAVASAGEAKKMDQGEEREEMHLYPDGEEEPVHGGWGRPSAMRIGLRENLGFALLIVGWLTDIHPSDHCTNHGGTDKDTATVISTMLLVSGITTILHSYFGTRLPLVQGSSFVYLAPALVIMNAQEYRNLTEHKFRHIMRELQGAIIIGSIFQSILGFTGLMSLLLRLINPIVVAPTVAAVGLAFFSYGFPQAGSCVEISIPQILLVLMFTLYLRGVNIFGHCLFRIYAVPLSIMIIWTYAFFLTAGGAYDYKGCTSDIPSSNILIDACRRHAYTMQHCRTDVSNAWRTAAWVRIPYPLQWGIPIFHFRTSIIMVFVSLVASIDSVGTYHSASMQINLKPPTRGIVSRGIALEGFCSILAGLWGSGTGSTTLTENVHTINITKVASRRVVELGAVFLIFFSFIGKVGAILASIPLALAASVLCFTWALVVALGLSTLQYSRAASFRNMMIVGVSLFLGLSIPAYFQQYQPETSFILPSYFIPYAAASNGPARTGSKQLDFAINALMSLNMVVTLVVALVLENTVPGSRQERGVYIWSKPEDIITDPSSLEDYSLPRKFSRCLCRSNCLGV